MDWDQILAATVLNAAFTAGVVAALGFIARSIIERWINKDLENHKARLEAARVIDLERLRADLTIAGHERETAFAWLHQERAKVIAELYRRLVQAETAYRRAFESTDSLLTFRSNAALLAALESSVSTFDYYSENRLYFSDKVIDGMKALDAEYTGLANQLILHGHVLRQNATQQPDAFYTEHYFDAWNTIYRALPSIRQGLETEFRVLLGDGGSMAPGQQGARASDESKGAH